MARSEFTVKDIATGKTLLKDATKEKVQELLRIADTTFYACIAEDRICRKRYRIIPQYQEKDAKIPDDLRQAWYAMQRLFGVEVPEADG